MPDKKFEDKTLGELEFGELKLNDPRYIEWTNKLGVPKSEMKPEEAAISLNLQLWQYVSMFGIFEPRQLIMQCLNDNRMMPSGEPGVFMFKGRKIHVNFEAHKGDIMEFKPTFTEVT
jgi:hypothetical protein